MPTEPEPTGVLCGSFAAEPFPQTLKLLKLFSFGGGGVGWLRVLTIGHQTPFPSPHVITLFIETKW